ncbi:hypothetical protein INR49_024312 [Caranx melampygus]|nr:hypothetical protein INR49_024312 [Caranx melampygus]
MTQGGQDGARQAGQGRTGQAHETPTSLFRYKRRHETELPVEITVESHSVWEKRHHLLPFQKAAGVCISSTLGHVTLRYTSPLCSSVERWRQSSKLREEIGRQRTSGQTTLNGSEIINLLFFNRYMDELDINNPGVDRHHDLTTSAQRRYFLRSSDCHMYFLSGKRSGILMRRKSWMHFSSSCSGVIFSLFAFLFAASRSRTPKVLTRSMHGAVQCLDVGLPSHGATDHSPLRGAGLRLGLRARGGEVVEGSATLSLTLAFVALAAAVTGVSEHLLGQADPAADEDPR